ncbi:MAG: ShlB/FhaC/HecB family hemolysin secretion/activation protein [Alphaproteobacteria bacterium]|nr:ShlB/FhaC/HecB family hemolysin secretion/activation protein [Alphaproteobacteria bacterium]
MHKKCFFRDAFLPVAMVLLATFPAYANNADISNASRENDRLQREQQLQLNNDLNNAARSTRPPATYDVPEPQIQHGKGDGCRQIDHVVLENAHNISEQVQGELVHPYEGRCLGVDDIQSLLADLTKYYIEHGYTTTRAYIPEQDLTTGTLRVSIVQGTVQNLKLEDGDKDSINVTGAFPLVEGQAFNIRDFEQGLDQVNRLASNHATMDVQPGDKAGDSVVVIKNEPEAPWHVNIANDDYGQRSTGRYQTALTGSYDNALGLNDSFSYTHRQSTPLSEHNKNSVSNNIFFSVPVGYFTFSAGYSNSAYQSQIVTPGNAILELAGDSQNVFVKGDYMAWRNQANKLDLSATMTQKNTNSYADNQLLEVSSRTLTVIDLMADLTMVLDGGATLDINGGVSEGVPFWGALQDAPDLDTTSPRAQFTKLVFGSSYNRPFEVADEKFSIATQLSAQYALNVLYGSEQMSIGGPYSVRGFYNTSVANDHGYYTHTDLSNMQTLWSYEGQDVTARPYLGFDTGYVNGRVSGTPSGSMVGTAVGVGLKYSAVDMDLFTAKSLVRPGTADEGLTSFFRLSLSF